MSYETHPGPPVREGDWAMSYETHPNFNCLFTPSDSLVSRGRATL